VVECPLRTARHEISVKVELIGALIIGSEPYAVGALSHATVRLNGLAHQGTYTIHRRLSVNLSSLADSGNVGGSGGDIDHDDQSSLAKLGVTGDTSLTGDLSQRLDGHGVQVLGVSHTGDITTTRADEGSHSVNLVGSVAVDLAVVGVPLRDNLARQNREAGRVVHGDPLICRINLLR